jgi:hypothetical protein
MASPTHAAPSSAASARCDAPRVATYTSQSHDRSTCTAKAVQPNPFAGLHARDAQSAKTDDAGTQERRRLLRRHLRRNRYGEILAHRNVLGEAAVAIVTREYRRIAKVLSAAAAIRARPVGPAQPRNAYELAGVRAFADDLVPRNDALVTRRQLFVDDVQVGAAHAACKHAKDDLAGARLRYRPLLDTQFATRTRMVHERLHRAAITKYAVYAATPKTM